MVHQQRLVLLLQLDPLLGKRTRRVPVALVRLDFPEFLVVRVALVVLELPEALEDLVVPVVPVDLVVPGAPAETRLIHLLILPIRLLTRLHQQIKMQQ